MEASVSLLSLVSVAAEPSSHILVISKAPYTVDDKPTAILDDSHPTAAQPTPSCDKDLVGKRALSQNEDTGTDIVPSSSAFPSLTDLLLSIPSSLRSSTVPINTVSADSGCSITSPIALNTKNELNLSPGTHDHIPPLPLPPPSTLGELSSSIEEEVEKAVFWLIRANEVLIKSLPSAQGRQDRIKMLQQQVVNSACRYTTTKSCRLKCFQQLAKDYRTFRAVAQGDMWTLQQAFIEKEEEDEEEGCQEACNCRSLEINRCQHELGHILKLCTNSICKLEEQIEAQCFCGKCYNCNRAKVEYLKQGRT